MIGDERVRVACRRLRLHPRRRTRHETTEPPRRGAALHLLAADPRHLHPAPLTPSSPWSEPHDEHGVARTGHRRASRTSGSSAAAGRFVDDIAARRHAPRRLPPQHRRRTPASAASTLADCARVARASPPPTRAPTCDGVAARHRRHPAAREWARRAVPEHPVLAKSTASATSGSPSPSSSPRTRAAGARRPRPYRRRLRAAAAPPRSARRRHRTPSPLHPHVGTNVVMRAYAGAGDVANAFESADVDRRGDVPRYPRLVATPMECRGIVAAPRPSEDGRLTVWTSTQVPHRVKTFLAMMLPGGLDVRVVAPDVGGGFGRKIEVWPEEVAVAVRRDAARRSGQVDRAALRQHGRVARARLPRRTSRPR